MELSIAEPEQSAELRDAFLHHLPQRLKTLLRRARAQSRSGWDINVLHLVQDEVANLAGACGRYGQLELGERLLELESALTPWTQSQQVPDPGAIVRIDAVLDGLRPHLEPEAPAYVRPVARLVTSEPAQVGEDDGYRLHETPPIGHWRNLGVPDFEPPAAKAASAQQPAPRPVGAPEGHSIYILGAEDPLLNELAMRMESRGCTVTPVEDVASLIEVLGALPPQLVVVGTDYAAELDHIGPALRAARASASHKVAMLAMLIDGDVAPRLRALRAGADRCVASPARLEDVLARVLDLLSTEDEEPYRILIVEDDTSQALFAESILRKAGMVTQVLNEPIAVLEELDRFQPDLLLMDLNMPGCDGLELTALIREREGYVSTPIVFLSGDPDADRQFAALDAGGDDFLSKPIRPKYLVSAVTNRVRRARASLKHARERRRRDPGHRPARAQAPAGCLERTLRRCRRRRTARRRAVHRNRRRQCAARTGRADRAGRIAGGCRRLHRAPDRTQRNGGAFRRRRIPGALAAARRGCVDDPGAEPARADRARTLRQQGHRRSA